MTDEMRFHLEMEVRDLMSSGMSREEAERQAKISFGSMDRYQEEAWDNRRMRPVETLVRDIRHTIRSLGRAPGFAIVAILTLALGIGANTAIFSVVNAVLLRPLPFRDPASIALLWSQKNGEPADLPFSYPTYSDVRKRTRAFDEVGAWSAFSSATLTATGCIDSSASTCTAEPESVPYGAASASMFDVLGVRMQRGRVYDAAGDAPGAADRVVVISDRLWRARYGADANIAGRTIILDGAPYIVSGVLPASFRFGGIDAQPDVWMPLAVDPASGSGNRSRLYARRVSFLGIAGRLKAGVTIDAANADIERIAAELRAEEPGALKDLKMRAVPLREQLVRDRRATLLALLAAVGLVLLISSANVANLLLMRATSRARELAVRLAMGASRRRLIAQLLTESITLSLCGALAGLAVARGLLQIVRQINLVPATPYVPYRVSSSDVAIDVPVLLFTMAISLLVGIGFGLVPALHATTDRSRLSLGAGITTNDPRVRRTRSTLIIAEVALSVLLLISATLMSRSLIRLTRVETGFDAGNVLTVRLTPSRKEYADPARLTSFYRDLLSRADDIPGVAAVGASDGLPLTEPLGSSDFRIAGRNAPENAADQWMSRYATATPGYLEALRVTVIAGRTLQWSDDANSRPVVVISQALAKRYWPGENPIGKRIGLSIEALRFVRDGPPIIDFDQAYREVVGVVADVRADAVAEEAAPMMYLPFMQRPETNMHVVMRAADRRGSAATLAAPFRDLLKQLDGNQAIDQVRTMESIVNRSLGDDRFRAYLISGFAALAVLLAAIGLYGVLAYSVGRRTTEIGVRLALGAQRSALLRLVMSDALILAGIGAVLGAGGAIGLSRIIQRFLFQTPAIDVLTIMASAGLMLVVAAVAAFVPARRAMRISAVEALRGS